MDNLISIVIPVFNRENYITECLNSIKDQTYKNFEIILVDDGSTDESVNLIIDFKNKNEDIKLKLIRQENKGPGIARNTGIKNSTGELIAFLDSDDLFGNNSLEVKNNFLKTNPQTDLVSTNAFKITAKGEIIGNYFVNPPSFNKNVLLKSLITENFVITSTVLIKKKILDELGAFSEDKEISVCEDYDLWLRLAKEGVSFQFLDYPLTYYRVSENSASSNSIQMLEKEILILKNLKKSDLLCDELSGIIDLRISKIYDLTEFYNFKNYLFSEGKNKTVAKLPFLISKGNKTKERLIKFTLKYFPNLYKYYFIKKYNLKKENQSKNF